MATSSPQPQYSSLAAETDGTLQWRERYDLNQDPLRSGYFFSGGQRQHYLEQLGYLCHYSDRILVLQGDSGIGKTTLLKRLLADEEGRLQPMFVPPDQEFSSPADVVRILGGQLPGPSAQDAAPPELLTRLLDFCRDLSSQGRRVLLVVDQAQDIEESRLEMFCELVRPALGEGVLGVLLLATPALGATLEKISARRGYSDWCHVIEMQPLSRDEAAAYIQGRLSHAGWSGTPPLPAQGMEKLLVQGRGLPGLLDRLAPQYLLGKSRTARKPVLRAGQGRWMILLLALLAVSFGLVAFQYSRERTQTQVADPVKDEEAPALRLRLAGEPVLLDLSQISQEEKSASLPEKFPSPELDALARAAENMSRPDALAPMPATRPSADVQEPAAPDNPSVAIPPVANPPAAAVAQPAVPATPASPPAMVEEVVKPESPKPALSPKPKTEPRATETARATKPSADAAPAKASPAKTPAHPNFRDANWLRQQSASAFTVQLLGSFSEATAQSFIESQAKPADYWYLKSRRQGKDWFIVLYGVYPSREAARAAVNGYPAHLKRLDPWVRQFQAIRQEVLGANS